MSGPQRDTLYPREKAVAAARLPEFGERDITRPAPARLSFVFIDIPASFLQIVESLRDGVQPGRTTLSPRKKAVAAARVPEFGERDTTRPAPARRSFVFIDIPASFLQIVGVPRVGARLGWEPPK